VSSHSWLADKLDLSIVNVLIPGVNGPIILDGNHLPPISGDPRQNFQLLDAVPDAVVVTSPDGRIEFVNGQVERLFGYTRDELIGQTVEILLPERYRSPHEKHRGKFREQPRTRHMGTALDLTGRRKDGSEVAVDISLAPFPTEQGSWVVAVIRDVSVASAERQGLEALHAVAVMSSGILDPAALGRLVVEAARGLLRSDDATLVWWDPLKGQLSVLADTFATPYAGTVGPGEGAVGIAFQRGEPVVVEDYPTWEHALRDSLPRGLKSAAAVPLLVRDKPVGALTVSFKTSRRVGQAELRLLTLLAGQAAPSLEAARLHDELLKVAAELKDATEAKSRFLASMSHELRTPLNAILGFSELIIDDDSEKFDRPTRRRFLEQINASGRHLLGLINDILDLSKVEAGQMMLQLQSVSIVEVATDIVNTMEPIAAKKKIVIAVDVAAGGRLRADGGKLRQMLLNLVSNAIKFTPARGTVTIKAQRFAKTVEISVADTGIGIAESDLGRLFKEFQQVESGAGGHQEGTGLGLALTKRLAALHGGDVRVASELGKGSIFTIELPVEAESPAAPVETPRRTPDGTRPLVLVVEDNRQAADLLVRQLDHGGFHCVVAANGTEALAKARELQPVAITLDILLPGIDGWDVLAQLKRDDATRDIPVVVVSVVDKPGLGRALGALDYFVKPVEGKVLLASLAKYKFTAKVGTVETRILVVDDEPANLEWLESVLKPAGFSVTSAGGGREGIDLARRNQPDLILLDLLMPEVSGFDVVEALNADESTRSIPIMIITAKDLTTEDKQQLNGHAKAILARGSTGATDILGWLGRLRPARP
jgi:PAS domain S-box-containing protein